MNRATFHRYLRFWGPDPSADVNEEFAFHIDMRVEELVARGWSPQAARDEVLRGFGDLDRVKDACRSLAEAREGTMRRSEWWRGWWQDVRYGVRQLVASPLLSAVLTITLGVGIGATVSIFSVVNAVLLRPLPYTAGDRMVRVWETLRENNNGNASVGHFHDWTEQGAVFEATAAVQGAVFNLTEAGDPEQLRGARVTEGYFRVANVPPALGRYFSAEEADAGELVVVLSHRVWQRRFGSDPAMLGRAIRLNGQPHIVVGVAPAEYALTDPDRGGFANGFSAHLWTPLTFSPEQRANYGTHAYGVIAALRPGVSVEMAQADMERVTRGIAEREPQNMAGRGVYVQSIREGLVGAVRLQILVLFASVSTVLLIGCVNVASLLLARATTRRKEIAIRAALGGGTSRIIRQLLTESLVLATAGGVVAVGVAALGIRFLIAAGPATVPRLAEAGLDPGVLLFALGLTLTTGLLFGLAPALRAGRPDLQRTLRSEGRSSIAFSGRDRVRSFLIVTEIAVTVVLLVSAGLFIRSAIRLQQVPFGIDTENVLTARIALPAARYATPESVATAYGRVMENARRVPGIRHAGAATTIPLGGGNIDATVTIEGKTFAPGEAPDSNIRLVTDGYLEAIGMRLGRGRLLQASDMRAGAPPVVVINERLADTLWPADDPLGKRLSTWAATSEPEWREVVGVVGDVWAFGLSVPPQPELFVPYTQAFAGSWDAFQRSMALVARTERDAGSYTSMLRGAVASVDPTLPLYDVRTMEEALDASVANRRFLMVLLSGLAGTGVLLAAVGLYGVLAYFVSERTPEIGLRLALGATPRSVLSMILRHSAALVLAGTALGIVAALAATRVLGSQLFEIQPNDLSTYVVGTLTLLAITLVASALPAIRATRIDPIRSLSGS